MERALTDFEIVNVKWSGRFEFSEDGLDNYDERLECNVGVYMITDAYPRRRGWFHVASLYIGKVDGTTFREEIKRHLRGDIGQWVYKVSRHWPSFKVGFVEPITSERLSRQLVRDVESLLIYDYKPPGNLSGVESYNGRDLMVRNLGRKMPLAPENISIAD